MWPIIKKEIVNRHGLDVGIIKQGFENIYGKNTKRSSENGDNTCEKMGKQEQRDGS